jgi:DNA-binding NarL/FixJ family response regulator
VLVILSGAAAPTGLARAAIRKGWPILQAPIDEAQLNQSVARGCSNVVIVHIAMPQEQGLEFVRVLRSSWRSVVVIAVADTTTEDAEVRARVAGAGLFLPASADADLIERTVLSLMNQGPRETRPSPPIWALGPLPRRCLG